MIAPPSIVTRMTTAWSRSPRLISGLNLGHRLFRRSSSPPSILMPPAPKLSVFSSHSTPSLGDRVLAAAAPNGILQTDLYTASGSVRGNHVGPSKSGTGASTQRSRSRCAPQPDRGHKKRAIIYFTP